MSRLITIFFVEKKSNKVIHTARSMFIPEAGEEVFFCVSTYAEDGESDKDFDTDQSVERFFVHAGRRWIFTRYGDRDHEPDRVYVPVVPAYSRSSMPPKDGKD